MIVSKAAIFVVAMLLAWASGREAGLHNWAWAFLLFLFGAIFMWIFWSVP